MLNYIHRFNPRTPCGVRLKVIHIAKASIVFQSTHSLRSATGRCTAKRWQLEVSIHALLAECDRSASAGLTSQGSFNPRTPCGVRRNRLYTLLLNRANHTLRQPP